MIRVLLVDDQVSVRRGLTMRLSLEPDIEIVGEAEDGETALALASALKPHVIIMDVEMPRMDGITATAALQSIAPQSAVIILSLHNDHVTRSRAAVAGAAAFVEKKGAEPTLLTTLRQVYTDKFGMEHTSGGRRSGSNS